MVITFCKIPEPEKNMTVNEYQFNKLNETRDKYRKLVIEKNEMIEEIWETIDRTIPYNAQFKFEPEKITILENQKEICIIRKNKENKAARITRW